MKYFNSFLYILFLLLFVACITDKKTEVQVEDDTKKDMPRDVTAGIKENCYLYTVNKDSISLKYTIVEDKVSGQMQFNFYEKDSSQGNFDGRFEGDTLIGTYDFKSEGLHSTRDIIFLKQDDILISGSGKIIQNGSSETFDPNEGFTFNSFKMQKINCDDLNFDWEFTSN